MFFRMWSVLFLALSVGVVLFAAAAEPRRKTLTDLPPAIVSGEVERMDILSDSAPVGEVILRICRGYSADCAVVIDSGGPTLAWTCSDVPAHCWRTFLSALSQLGVNVRILPGVGGASYSFSFGSGSLVGSGGRAADSPASPASR